MGTLERRNTVITQMIYCKEDPWKNKKAGCLNGERVESIEKHYICWCPSPLVASMQYAEF
jgi:hypothetical protein